MVFSCEKYWLRQAVCVQNVCFFCTLHWFRPECIQNLYVYKFEYTARDVGVHYNIQRMVIFIFWLNKQSNQKKTPNHMKMSWIFRVNVISNQSPYVSNVHIQTSCVHNVNQTYFSQMKPIHLQTVKSPRHNAPGINFFWWENSDREKERRRKNEMEIHETTQNKSIPHDANFCSRHSFLIIL